MATELVEEREKCNFDTNELHQIIQYVPPEFRANFEKDWQVIENDPDLKLTHKYYEMTREEIQLMWMKKLHKMYMTDKEHYFGRSPTPQYFW